MNEETDLPDVMQLIEMLLPFVIPLIDNITDPEHPKLSYRLPQAETQHRQYNITGVRANENGDPVITISFAI